MRDNHFIKKYENKIILILGAILFLAVNLGTLKNGHNWGDDFSQYIVHAQNIAEHKPYAQGLILNTWEIPSPGFPLLLAPLVKFFGINFQVLKFWNVPGWLIFSYFMFLLARKRLKEEHAVLFFLFLLSSPFFFIFKQSVISDVPFLAFFAPALFFWTEYLENEMPSQNRQRLNFLYAVGLTVGAFMVRYGPGLILFLAIILYLLCVKKKRAQAFMMVAVLLATLGTLTLWGSNVLMRAREIPLSFWISLRDVFSTISYSWAYLVVILMSNIAFFSVSAERFLFWLVGILAVPMALAMIVIFSIRVIKKNASLMEWFFVLYFFAIVFWYLPDKVSGARYLLPIAGLAVIFAVEICCDVLQKISSVKGKTFSFFKHDLVGMLFIVALFCNIVTIVQIFSFNDDDIMTPETVALVQKMDSIIHREEVFTAVRARALSLLAKRQGVRLYEPFDALMQNFHVDYFIKLKPRWVSQKKWKRESIEKDYASVFDFVPVWENDYYVIFKIKPKEASSDKAGLKNNVK